MTPKFRALILTAIPIEFAAISEYLSDIKNEDNKYDIGIISLNNICWEIVLVETDMLNAAAGIETTQGIIKYNPDIVLFVGIAGGIKKVSHGDLVCPQKVIGYESGKADDDYKLRLEEYRPKDDMVQLARNVIRGKKWTERIIRKENKENINVIVEPMVSGEKVISSTKSDLYKSIAQNCSSAVAVDMEGVGFLQAIHKNQNPDALLIRGISDLIDDKNDENDAKWQPIAAQNAAAFAFEVLALYGQTQQNNKKPSLNTKSKFTSQSPPPISPPKNLLKPKLTSHYKILLGIAGFLIIIALMFTTGVLPGPFGNIIKPMIPMTPTKLPQATTLSAAIMAVPGNGTELDWEREGTLKQINHDYLGANYAYIKAIELNPNSSMNWRNLGNNLISIKKYSEAVEAFDKAIYYDSNNTGAWIDKGSALIYLGKNSEALSAFDHAILLDPTQKQAWHNKGVVLKSMKRYPEALSAFKKAIAIDPNLQIAIDNKTEIEKMMNLK